MLSADGFIKAAGTVLRDGHGAGDVVLLQGTNLGGWLLKEGWMTPMDSSGTIPDDYTARQTILTRFGTEIGQRVLDDYENSWITLNDLDNIKAMGMNVVRLPLWYRNFQNEVGTSVGSPFTRIDWLVSNAWARGIYTILDFHGVVGGQSTADHTGRVRATAEFWSNATDQQRTIDIWKQIAQHYKNNPGVAGYDLINEPTGAPNSSAVWNMYDRMYDAIRPVDPDHLIIMEGAFGNWDWDMLPNPATFGWTNVMYQMHEYQFGGDATAIKAGTDHQVADFVAHKNWNVPAYVGEFNDFSPPPDPASVWAYTVQQYQAAGINWSEWSYKSSNGSGTNSWGIYNKLPSGTAVPNLQTDDSATISNKWKAWVTDTSSVVNPMLLSALTVGLGALPAGFTDADVNVAGLPGKASFDALTGTWTLWGSGADIWGTADQFNFASKAFSGDGTIIAKVSNDSNTDLWAKTGVMFRDGTGAGAVYAAIMTTPGNGVTFQWRNVLNGSSNEAHILNIPAPVILRLVRTGNSFSAYYGYGGAWTQVGTTQSVAMSSSVRAGLVTTAHNNSMLNTGTFKGVSILPAGWLSQDVGAQNGGWAGTDAPAGNTWTVAGGGPSATSGSDSYNFTYRSWSGDGVMKAKLASFTNTLNASRAGLMFGAAADAGSAGAVFANVYLTSNDQVGFRWRSTIGGAVLTAQVSAGGAQWIRLIRTGSSFAAYFSADNVHWTRIDLPQNIAMPTTAQVGIVVDSTDISKLSQATFTGVLLSQKLSVSLAGTAGDDNYYVRRNGSNVDIWRNADGSGPPVQSVDVDETGTLSLNGAEGNDTFILDASGGAPFLAPGADVINGAGGNDVVRLIGLSDTAALRFDSSAFYIGAAMGVGISGIEAMEVVASKVASLMITSGATGVLANGGGTLQTGTLSVASDAQLDLRNNTLIVTGGDLMEINNLVASGRNAGTSGRWSGLGITNSTAAAKPLTGLAVFSDSRGVVVKYTWLGDLDGNGMVNADDYARIDAGFASRATGYGNGDIDYRGSINSDDYFYIDLGFSSQGTPLAPQAATSGTAGPTKSTGSKLPVAHKLPVTHRHHRRGHWDVSRRSFTRRGM